MENKEEIINSAISKITDYLRSLEATDKDKANKLSYWLKDYVSFLKKEESFDPSKCIKYKRGDIIKVHLGFNIGSEEGGLHYAVVLDNNNSKYSSVLTIVPLTSVKPHKDLSKLRDFEVYCSNAIYSSLIEKSNSMETKLQKEISRLEDEVALLIGSNEIADRLIVENLQERLIQCKAEANRLLLIKREIEKMKKGSIALVSQITTISKIRILNPISKYDVLHGIHMPSEYLDTIDERIKLLYVKNKQNVSKPLTKV